MKWLSYLGVMVLVPGAILYIIGVAVFSLVLVMLDELVRRVRR